MSPSATCCFTTSYSAAVSFAGFRRISIGNADLADVVQEAGGTDRVDGRRLEPELLARGTTPYRATSSEWRFV